MIVITSLQSGKLESSLDADGQLRLRRALNYAVEVPRVYGDYEKHRNLE